MAKTTGLLLCGSMKSAGITFYQKRGQVIVRSARADERRSNTRGQFVQRQRMRHTTALWQMIKHCGPLFSGDRSDYACFASLANRLPAVFVPHRGPLVGASFLMPGIPVSDGTLPPIVQWLGEADGTPALLTTLRASDLHVGETLLLYTAWQCIEGRLPRIRFQQVREIRVEDCVVVDGCLALAGDEFADAMKGWALVRLEGSPSAGKWRCSSQSLVTSCTAYVPFTTEEALLEAAKSYGGLTGAHMD